MKQLIMDLEYSSDATLNPDISRSLELVKNAISIFQAGRPISVNDSYIEIMNVHWGLSTTNKICVSLTAISINTCFVPIKKKKHPFKE